MRTSILALLAILPLTTPGCVGGCTLEARSAVNVAVTDAASGGPIEAVITVRDGDFVEVLEGSDGSYFGAFERAGTYDITIEAPGFVTVELEDVEVAEGECHVEPVSRAVELTAS